MPNEGWIFNWVNELFDALELAHESDAKKIAIDSYDLFRGLTAKEKADAWIFMLGKIKRQRDNNGTAE